MLVIITILALLIATLTPSILKARIMARIGVSKSRIALIDTGCEMFHEDFGYYPPSYDDTKAYFNQNIAHGKELIVLFMTGYANDDGTKGSPGNPMVEDDGKDGFGFRTVKRGKVYGPYNGTENIPTSIDRTFIDAFDNEILYYRYDTDDNEYKYRHNIGGPNDEFLNGGAGVEERGCVYYRKNFILLSTGSNGQWGTDDIMNFEKE